MPPTRNALRFGAVKSEWLERIIAVFILLAISPLFVLLSLAVAIEDGGPVLFRQKRVGRGGRVFDLFKFRSMRDRLDGPLLTARGDARVTRVGRILRRYKLDELAQIWNVIRGDVALIGPRPEVPAFVDPSDPLWRSTLDLKPGITGLASLVYRNEEALLAQVHSPDQYYRAVILPDKLQLNLSYAQNRSVGSDLKLIWLTLRSSLTPGSYDSAQIRRQLAVKDKFDEPVIHSIS